MGGFGESEGKIRIGDFGETSVLAKDSGIALDGEGDGDRFTASLSSSCFKISPIPPLILGGVERRMDFAGSVGEALFRAARRSEITELADPVENGREMMLSLFFILFLSAHALKRRERGMGRVEGEAVEVALCDLFPVREMISLPLANADGMNFTPFLGGLRRRLDLINRMITMNAASSREPTESPIISFVLADSPDFLPPDSRG
jgi:hypothetical protein